MRSLISRSCCSILILGLLQRPSLVSAWTWSLSNNNDCISTGPQVSGHTCVTIPSKIKSPTGYQGNNENDKIFLFGGQLPPENNDDDSNGPEPELIGGAGASVGSSKKVFTPSKPQTPLEARAESARKAAEAAAAKEQNPSEMDVTPDGSATITATHDLWVYEKDKPTTDKPDWTLISRKAQGVTRPTPRTHAATAVLGHMMFLFGGYDPSTGTELSDVWTLSLKSNKWSLCQAWMPFEVSKHSACAIDEHKIALFTKEGGSEVVWVYDDDLPTPSVLEQKTTGEGPPVGLRLCASCGIPRTTDAGADNKVHDMLIFGGSTEDKWGFSADAFRLDTKSWEWTKLRSTSPKRPQALQGASIASLRNTKQSIIFGGAAVNKRDGKIVPSDETWMLTVGDDGKSANWEQIAVENDVNANANTTPEGRLFASLTATSSEELVLQGGYNPTTKQTYGGTPGTSGGGGTWILTKNPIDHSKLAQEKAARQRKIEDAQLTQAEAAASRVSDIIAQAGSGMGFDGTSLGVGGLDHVLEEVKTRIWTPLAAPPKLLKELGIQPTRGLLLYGGPGCGKTLLASTLGSMLSPFRPITVVNGPEILDKFVGSSEQNLRNLFDNPPDIYDEFKRNETDGGEALGRAAVHIVVMDEFDAVARARGGSSGAGGQGDAGVARDSVVNQLLSKMDGVQPLKVPTLVIGLTNKRELIDPALLRPGRFEVQIEIEPPKTMEQRRSIVLVHTRQMFNAGRLQVNDPPPGSAAANQLESAKHLNILTYEQLADQLAKDCDGFSGAAIAGVTRAAASRALARSVGRLSGDWSTDENASSPASIMDCLVTQDDFYQAIHHIRGRSEKKDDAVVEDKVVNEVVVEVADGKGVNVDGRVGFRARIRQRIRTWKNFSP